MDGKYGINEIEYLANPQENEDFNRAKRAFLKRDFKNARDLLEMANRTCGKEYAASINTNLALMYHLLGEHEAAEEKYKSLENSIFKEINYYAFCHRDFHYFMIEDKNVKNTVPLYSLLQHNRVNYLLNAHGAANRGIYENYCHDVYGEQILNDGYIKQGERVRSKHIDRIREQFIQTVSDEKCTVNKACGKKMRIGIFVTDIQRHKDAAIIFDLADILLSFAEVYIYFNNIEANKLTKILEKKTVIRHTVNMSFTQVNNLMVRDELDGVIDLAEYGLRNNKIALTFWDMRTIKISDILEEHPLVLESSDYFPQLCGADRKGGAIAVIGDVKYMSDAEICYIKKYIDMNQKVIFESPAFDDLLCRMYFEKKLHKSGIHTPMYEIKAGIRPFSEYLKFLSSIKMAIVINGASHTELSELIYSGVPAIVLSNNVIIRKIANLLKMPVPHYEVGTEPAILNPDTYNYYESSTISLMRERFAACLKREIDKFDGDLTLLDDKEYVVVYDENGRHYCINCTCNGDIIVFDDIIGANRNEYIIA